MFAKDKGLRIGTSSWSSTDWVGPFYPEGTQPEAFIEYYSGRFDTVEIDATFYRMPSARNVAAWKSRTPEGFKFAVKTPRTITHEKVLLDAEDDMRLFLDIITKLDDRLGPILLQFPYFNKKAFETKTPFLERLDEFLQILPEQHRFAVEIRNRAWVRDVHTLCKSHKVALAWIEQAWMPSAVDWPKLTGGPSTDFAYLRFLGDHKGIEEMTTRWDRLVIDQTGTTRCWVDIIKDLRARAVEVNGYFNNHFAGFGPGSIALFEALYQ